MPKKAVAGTVAAAALVTLFFGIRALLRAPLNVDEALTIRVARDGFGAIFSVVRHRGGGPFHFWLEHVAMSWPGGLTGLRLPSVLFAAAALPAVALIADELAGPAEAAATVLLLCSSPLFISYSSFGRPHSMLLAWLSWGTVVGLRAARSGDPRWWVGAGVALGSSVFVHPTAPLYALTAFGCMLVYTRRPLQAWPGVIAFAIALVPYYVSTAHALSDRYGVGGGTTGRTFTGNPVWQDAVHFVSPRPHLVNVFTVAAALGLVALLARGRWRSAAVIALTVATPVVFFSVVPTSGLSALFFDRYMLPALPYFLLLVSAGCVAVARLAWRLRYLALAALVGWLMSYGIDIVRARQSQLAKLGLAQVTKALRSRSSDTVLFGSSGYPLPGGFVANFTFGRPPNLADRYLSLRVPALRFVNDDSCEPVVQFLASGDTPMHGLWVFWIATPEDHDKAIGQFDRIPGLEISEPYRRFLILRSTSLPSRRLVQLSLAIRKAWLVAVPFNQRATLLRDADATALRDPAACTPVGVLGDPDIVPNYPLPPTP